MTGSEEPRHLLNSPWWRNPPPRYMMQAIMRGCFFGVRSTRGSIIHRVTCVYVLHVHVQEGACRAEPSVTSMQAQYDSSRHARNGVCGLGRPAELAAGRAGPPVTGRRDGDLAVSTALRLIATIT